MTQLQKMEGNRRAQRYTYTPWFKKNDPLACIGLFLDKKGKMHKLIARSIPDMPGFMATNKGTIWRIRDNHVIHEYKACTSTTKKAVVTLRVEGVRKTYILDRLIMKAFRPNIDFDLVCVKHRDKDQSNCELNNLFIDDKPTKRRGKINLYKKVRSGYVPILVQATAQEIADIVEVSASTIYKRLTRNGEIEMLPNYLITTREIPEAGGNNNVI